MSDILSRDILSGCCGSSCYVHNRLARLWMDGSMQTRFMRRSIHHVTDRTCYVTLFLIIHFTISSHPPRGPSPFPAPSLLNHGENSGDRSIIIGRTRSGLIHHLYHHNSPPTPRDPSLNTLIIGRTRDPSLIMGKRAGARLSSRGEGRPGERSSGEGRPEERIPLSS